MQLSNNDHERETYVALIAYVREYSMKNIEGFHSKLIESGIIPQILRFASATTHEDLMHELTWLVLNFSATENKDQLEHLLNPKQNGD